MDVRLEKTIENDELIITFRISNPSVMSMPDPQVKALNHLKNTVDQLIDETDDRQPLFMEMVAIREDMKDKIFKVMIDEFKARMGSALDLHLVALYNEIYNWTFDNQTEEWKSRLLNFGFQKQKYYFDNDFETKRNEMKQEPEFNIDIDDGDDDEEQIR